MQDEQPKSASKKIVNPVEGSSALAPEMSLDFSRPPTRISKPKVEMDAIDEGEFTSEEPLQALQQVTSIKYRSIDHPNHKLRFVFGIVLLVLVFGGLFVALPYYLMRSDRAINQAVKESIKYVQKNLEKRGLGARTRDYAEGLIAHLKMRDAPGTNVAAAKSWHEMECRFLVQEALSRRLRGTLEPLGQYLLTNCQLMQDQPQVALRLVTENYGDANQFQRNGESWEMLPMQLIASEAQRRTQTFHMVAPKNFPNCRRWGSVPSCLLKFIDQARQPVRNKLDDGYPILKAVMKNQSPVLQAWLGLAAAWNQTKLGDYAEVEQLLKETADLFPALYDPFLEREVFRLRLFNAFRLRDKKLSALIWKGRPTRLMSEDEGGFADAALIRSLLQKPEKVEVAIDEFFSHPESFQRFRFDPVFIRVLVEQSLRHQRAADALSYIDRINDQQDEDKGLDNEWLPLLRARVLLAQQDGLEALQTLQPLEKFVVRSQELAHLKGLAMLQAYSTKPYRIMAAAEFQKAVNLEPRAEHFFALIVSFLDIKDNAKADAAYKFWQKAKPRAGDELWRSLAHGLIVYSQGQPAAATQIWNELAQRNPGFDAVKRLLTNLSEDPKYLQDQMVKRVAAMLPVDGPLNALAVFP